ncbi:3-deoxy-D-manno-octulosonic-acid transferase [Lishizhenia tianjinensis]|uniref:3-deoxy-D-manno-octulosonic acid transferase n=1 Tax=Lishizhenia tianjinensis TaxID=477690 RepID=A0A1I7BNK5_9FLAO|nr:glycosyltransferase N-terminal domain-containing protein [Lishizhenia tianjinensis]SFT88746.1 3-deoxy-D-manno-octulosonic-acid transferase [Lishizhenia tianjinensis]
MLFYSIGIRTYALLVAVASIFNPKAKLWLNGRKNWRDKLPKTDKDVVWFHAASLGEFEQGRPIIEDYKKEHPEAFILLTFFSPSGYEIRKNYEGADYICYLPLDTKKNAKDFLAHFQPKTVFFIKYEFWLRYIFEAKKQGSKLYVISALFRENQRFFKWYGNNFRKALNQFDQFFVQNQKSATLLESIGITKYKITGDTRYDRVMENARKVKSISKIENWLQGEKALIIGSSWKADEEILAPFINENYGGKVILASHEVGEERTHEILKTFSLKSQRYTELGEEINTDTQLLVIDCIGILANVYQYGKMAYVGGGFGTGLHNILEPSAFGLPVVFGPIHKKFPEAQIHIDQGIAFSVSTTEELQRSFENISENLEVLKSSCLSFMKESTGAREIIKGFVA